MRARWVMATSVALVAGGYATYDTTFSFDHTLAVESGAGPGSAPQTRREWRDRFEVNKADLLPAGTNPYITIQPGRVLHLKHGNDTLTVTILPETQEVDGIVAGVLEERETKNGKLVEVSRNFMVTDRNTGDVYYFGEDVDNYKDGKVVNH